MASYPDGPVFLILGNKKVAPSEVQWPYYPRLLRFDSELRPEEAFNARVASLGQELAEMTILGPRKDGGLIVSLYHPGRGSRVLFLAPDGPVQKQIQFCEARPASGPTFHRRAATGMIGEGLLYPPLAPGRSGLAKKSFALIDHLRSIDKRRIRRVFGELAREEIAAIDEGLGVFLGLGGWLHGAGAPAVQ